MAGKFKSILAPAGASQRIQNPLVAIVAREADPRERLTAILAAGGLEVVARAWDVEGLVVEAADEPDVIVHLCRELDRPGALRGLSRRFPGRRNVVVAPSVTRHGARKAIEAGIAGIVLEPDADVALCLAVRNVAVGQLSIPVSLADGLDRPVLSSREKQVLGMVAMGFTNSQIAGRLFLAESTVKSHLSSIFRKLGVRSRTEAAELVLDRDSGFGAGILTMSEPIASGNGGST